MNMSDFKTMKILCDIRDAIASIHWCLDGPISTLTPKMREPYSRILYENIDSYIRQVTGILSDAADAIEDETEARLPGEYTHVPEPLPWEW